MSQVKEQEVTELDEKTQEPYVLILHNDDYNTFDWVIKSLVQLLNHTATQAEQCAWIVHTKGSCKVKHGYYEQLMDYHLQFSERGISTSVEENN